MGKAEETSSTLVVVNGALLTNKQRLARFQKNTAKQLALIERTETDNVKRRLFVGLALHVIKESLAHGEWLPWLKKNAAKEASLRQCHYMMAAAAVWVEQSRVARPDVAALPAGNFSLKVKDGAMRKLNQSAAAFVGELTWGELLDQHGLRDAKKLGGTRPKGGKDNADIPDEEQLYLFARDEIGGFITQGETLLLKENRLQFLAKHPEEVRGVVTSLRALADRVEQAAKPLLEKSA